jgi:hypothetical protein
MDAGCSASFPINGRAPAATEIFARSFDGPLASGISSPPLVITITSLTGAFSEPSSARTATMSTAILKQPFPTWCDGGGLLQSPKFARSSPRSRIRSISSISRRRMSWRCVSSPARAKTRSGSSAWSSDHVTDRPGAVFSAYPVPRSDARNYPSVFLFHPVASYFTVLAANASGRCGFGEDGVSRRPRAHAWMMSARPLSLTIAD